MPKKRWCLCRLLGHKWRAGKHLTEWTCIRCCALDVIKWPGPPKRQHKKTIKMANTTTNNVAGLTLQIGGHTCSIDLSDDETMPEAVARLGIAFIDSMDDEGSGEKNNKA